jgi:hypothetical protein
MSSEQYRTLAAKLEVARVMRDMDLALVGQAVSALRKAADRLEPPKRQRPTLRVIEQSKSAAD